MKKRPDKSAQKPLIAVLRRWRSTNTSIALIPGMPAHDGFHKVTVYDEVQGFGSTELRSMMRRTRALAKEECPRFLLQLGLVFKRRVKIVKRARHEHFFDHSTYSGGPL